METLMRANPWLFVAGLAWIIAQILKIVLEGLVTKKIDIGRLIDTGGMPSSHTALVSGLSTSVGITEGWGSAMFAISAAFSLIVIYDATNLRRNAGHQAEVINRLIPQLLHGKHIHPGFNFKELRELLGHTPFEVSIGALVGIIIAFWVDSYLGLI
jgi:uncharacterized protein